MKLTLPVNDRDHARGNKNAPVTLLEYGDFQCPYCGEAYPIVEEIQRIKGNGIRIVFRNFPLSGVHPNARNAAYAAEAAAKQGKFWEMYNVLFENQDKLKKNELIDYAKELSLDIKQFEKDIKSEAVVSKVEDDFMSGVKSGVNGTPTFFINGARFDKPYELDLLLEAIDAAASCKKRR
jgi:protein-disulfide isomerase